MGRYVKVSASQRGEDVHSDGDSDSEGATGYVWHADCLDREGYVMARSWGYNGRQPNEVVPQKDRVGFVANQTTSAEKIGIWLCVAAWEAVRRMQLSEQSGFS